MTLFLKLGGSLITDKTLPRTALHATIARLAGEIHAAQVANPALKLIIGHGSGSFGHIPADTYKTRAGVTTPGEWQGFLDVWRQARDLNQIMVEILSDAGIPVISFPPSTFLQANNGQPSSFFADPLISALQAGLTPLVAGDVIFDSVLGGTIFSTEEVFLALAKGLCPQRVLLCGSEAGVFEDFPRNTRLLTHLMAGPNDRLPTNLGGSAGVDVTGGMRTKVDRMLQLVRLCPGVRINIFSGSQSGVLLDALMGSSPGTSISLSAKDMP